MLFIFFLSLPLVSSISSHLNWLQEEFCDRSLYHVNTSHIVFEINILLHTRGAKKCIHILRDVIYVLLFEVALNYGSNV
jgi:hypothetical protein